MVIPDLDPRHDGLRIAHLSDIHVGYMTPRGHVRRAVEMANDADADVIAMTGDFVCWRRDEVAMLEDQLAGLRARRRVIATLGNHDYYADGLGVGAALARHGYDVLRNRNTTVDVDGAPLRIVGVDDPVTRHHDLDASFRGVGRGTVVSLCHCPEKVDGLAARGSALTLSGHTHGGQIYIRGITDRLAARMGRRYLSGFYDVAGRHLYVTSGVGFSGVRVRHGEGTTAEVAVLTLRRAPSND